MAWKPSEPDGNPDKDGNFAEPGNPDSIPMEDEDLTEFW
jgi:hypothetical protein